jgi:hypothetical protein
VELRELYDAAVRLVQETQPPPLSLPRDDPGKQPIEKQSV